MAILSSVFNSVAGMGFKMVPADKEEYDKYKAKLRNDYRKALWDLQRLFLGRKAFYSERYSRLRRISVGREALRENNYYDMFYEHHDPQVRLTYTNSVGTILEQFNDGTRALEILMREHVEGRKLG